MVHELAGKWMMQLDEEDRGIQEEWYANTLQGEEITIPGTTASNGKGNLVPEEEGLTKEAVRCLRQTHQYIGACFYQTEFTMDMNDRKDYILSLERVMFQSQVWIDDHYVGMRDSLSVAHTYSLKRFMKSGVTHRLTICVDNRDVQNIGNYPSAYTDETQTIWNGMVGSIKIQEQEQCCIDKMILSMNSDGKVLLKGTYHQHLPHMKANLSVAISDIELMQEIIVPIEIEDGFAVTFALNEQIKLWDEFSPMLYSVTVIITTEDGTIMTKVIKSGFRSLDNANGILSINGIQRFLRGNIDCCIYPLTGYPPMTCDEWRKVFNTTKAYGFNHVRFHSWCPPEAAFVVADELGLYLQVEAPIWMDNWMDFPVGCKEEHHTYLPQEAERIVWEYSSHPSFCIFANGNEINGDFSLLEVMTQRARNVNPNIWYTLTSNWDRPVSKEDDIFIAQSVDNVGVRGQYFLDEMVDTSLLSFEEGISKRQVPVIAHEVGQYVVYPDVNEISQYTGVLQPSNLKAIKEDLEEKNMLQYVPSFVHASGILSKNLYKAELEAALRTKNQGGIQILSLHDFPGQSTATIGMLNPFFESKGILEAKEFCEFCNDVVPLAKLEKFQYDIHEAVHIEFSIANYSGKELEQVKFVVRMVNERGVSIYEYCDELEKVAVGVYDVEFKVQEKIFEKLKGRNQISLLVQVGDYINHWDVWAYEPIATEVNRKSYSECCEEMFGELQEGKTVLLCPDLKYVKEKGPSCYFPVFWSPVHFASKDNCGMILDVNHPLFHKYYKTSMTGSYEWKTFLENTSSMIIDCLSNYEPINLLVPNFYNNHRCTHLLEARVGKGKLFICLFDFTNAVSKRMDITYLQQAIYQYIDSEDFQPTQELSVEAISGLFQEACNVEEREDIAAHKISYADSKKSNAYGWEKGNDNNSATCWMAGDAEVGHYWYVDLGKSYVLTGSKVVFHEKATFLYVIHVSEDGKNWDMVINKTGEVKPFKEQEDEFSARARYVRITYNGLQSGIWAGHERFSVYVQ